jgi:hypothetical protein
MTAARDGARAAARFTAVALAAAVVLVVGLAPAALKSPAALAENTIAYPLGLTAARTPAQSPLPGHVLATFGQVGQAAALVLLIASGLAMAVWLFLRPPATPAAAGVRLTAGLVLMFGLSPETRFGYFFYPIALLAGSFSPGRPPRVFRGRTRLVTPAVAGTMTGTLRGPGGWQNGWRPPGQAPGKGKRRALARRPR